jgi:hypothetical protein
MINMTMQHEERDPERWRLAFHEAAHAALYSSITAVGYVTLNPTMIGREMCPAHIHLDKVPKNRYQKLVGHLVGLAAERIILGLDYAGETQDLINARETAATMDRDWPDVKAHAEAAAETFVRKNQDQIVSLAGFLDQQGELSGLEVEVFLQRKPPLQAVPPALTKHPGRVLDGTVSMGKLSRARLEEMMYGREV